MLESIVLLIYNHVVLLPVPLVLLTLTGIIIHLKVPLVLAKGTEIKAHRKIQQFMLIMLYLAKKGNL